MKKIYCILFLAFSVFPFLTLLSSCNSSTDSSVMVLDVDPAAADELDLSGHASVELQGGAGKIGYIQNAVVTDDEVFIRSGGFLHEYGADGSYRRQIGNKGRALGEYIECSFFTFRNDTLFLYDFNGGKIMAYGRSGNFLSSYQAPSSVRLDSFLPFDGQWIGRCVFLGTYNGNPPALGLYDNGFNFVSHLEGVTLSSSYGVAGNIAEGRTGSVLFWHCFHDRIFRISRDAGCSPAYEISFGKYSFPSPEPSEDYDYGILMSFRDEDWCASHAGCVENVVEDDRYLSFTYRFNGDVFIFRYDTLKDMPVVNSRISVPGGYRLSRVVLPENGKACCFMESEDCIRMVTVKL